jgi:hypothetical protein
VGQPTRRALERALGGNSTTAIVREVHLHANLRFINYPTVANRLRSAANVWWAKAALHAPD